MVSFKVVDNIRPNMMQELGIGKFSPRTPAIQEAFLWGKTLHAGQKRLSGEPYFETHCVWIANFLDHLVANEAWTIAALLHDCVEDMKGSLSDIQEKFPGPLGDNISYIVDGVTKLSTPHTGRSRELETLRKLASFRDPGVFLVKLADKTHNMMTLEHMPSHKQVQKAEEAIRAYGKLAGILNCYKWRRWLEDIAFPFADRETYDFVKGKIDEDPRLGLAFINEMQANLARIMEKAGVEGRIEVIANGYWMAWQKMRRLARVRKTSLDSFAAINDIISFRMVIDKNQEELCYSLLPSINRYLGPYLDQNRFDDYIACPQNGYRAIQITAWLPDFGAVEVAVTTEEMEGENHWGIIHAIQKGKDLSAYRPMAVLTPTGGVRFVPDGSTVLDAVASIQQEFLLDKISSVNVNGGLARLADKVKPGDIIEVITSGHRIKPSEEWLNFCNEQTARLLRDVLVTEALKRSAEHGRVLISSILAGRGILFLEDLQVLEKDRFDNILEILACVNLEDLYSAIGGGAVRLKDFSSALNDLLITKEGLNWTTINMVGTSQSNKPGTLVKLTGVVSHLRGNIIRSITNTLPDGSFALRLVLKNLPPGNIDKIIHAYQESEIELKSLEVL